MDFAGQSLLVPVKPRQYIVGKAMALGIRPEHMHLGEGDINVPVTPAVIERLGINTIAYANLPTGEPFCALLPGRSSCAGGGANSRSASRRKTAICSMAMAGPSNVGSILPNSVCRR